MSSLLVSDKGREGLGNLFYCKYADTEKNNFSIVFDKCGGKLSTPICCSVRKRIFDRV
jgi:hypothetical protein